MQLQDWPVEDQAPRAWKEAMTESPWTAGNSEGQHGQVKGSWLCAWGQQKGTQQGPAAQVGHATGRGQLCIAPARGGISATAHTIARLHPKQPQGQGRGTHSCRGSVGHLGCGLDLLSVGRLGGSLELLTVRGTWATS